MIIVLLYSLLPGLLLQGLDNLKTFLEAVRKCTVGCTALRLVVCAYVCVYFSFTRKARLSIGWQWDQAASPCYRRHNQVGPGGLWLSWPRNTRGCSMGRKLLGGWSEADDMVCDRDSSFECDTSI